MALESVNTLLRWVGAMIMGGYKFEFIFVLIHNYISECLWTFVVHFMDRWTETTFCQVLENILVNSDVFCCGAVLHGAYNNPICVINITHDYVVVAPAGDSRETSC